MSDHGEGTIPPYPPPRRKKTGTIKNPSPSQRKEIAGIVKSSGSLQKKKEPGSTDTEGSKQVGRHDSADIESCDRLQGFSDAVYATAATLLIVPVRKFEHDNEHGKNGGRLRDALMERWQQFVVFIFGYLVICSVWESQIIRFRLLKRVDDVVVALTLISLMVTTFLPFTIELETFYADKKSPIMINAVILIVLEILELIIFIYGFHTPDLLSRKFVNLSPMEQSLRKKQLLIKMGINFVLFVLAMGIGALSHVASAILVSFVIFTPLLRQLMVKCTRYWHTEHINSDVEVLTGRMGKERIEIFSDAAMGIISTLLVLDLTTEDFPGKKRVNELGLTNTLLEMRQEFVAYIGTFVTVGLLWFVHHSVIQKIETFTPVMVLLNNLFLAFTAFSPFISTLANHYTGHVSHDEEVAVRLSSLLLLISSLMLLFIFLSAILQEESTFYEWAVVERHKPGNNSRLYLFLKTLIIPSTSFAVLMCSVLPGTQYASFVAYHLALLCVPLLFVLLKIVFACHCLNKQEKLMQQLRDEENEEEVRYMQSRESLSVDSVHTMLSKESVYDTYEDNSLNVEASDTRDLEMFRSGVDDIVDISGAATGVSSGGGDLHQHVDNDVSGKGKRKKRSGNRDRDDRVHRAGKR